MNFNLLINERHCFSYLKTAVHQYHEEIIEQMEVRNITQDIKGVDMLKNSRKMTRVLVAKIGLDGHDRGAKIISKALRDAGMEVIYTGLKKTPQEITKIAIEEDVNIIGVSILSGAHMTLLPELCQLLREKEAGDIHVIAGGIIPRDDIPALEQSGIKGVFGPGTKTEDVINFVQSIINS